MKPARRSHLPGLAESRLLQSLLRERGSLTRRLVALSSGHFAVQVDRSQWAPPSIIEALAIGVRVHERALIREVTLMCSGRPAVYARSIIPAGALRGRYRGLARLGNRPLGELLFTDHRVRRGRTRSFIVRDGDPLFDNARRRAPTTRSTFWGRATLFYIDGEPLLVTEVFLDFYD